MLSELAEYACSHNLVAQAGFKPKALKGYIHLSEDGEFIGITVREKGAESVYAPDIGSAANGTRYCNPLIEKAKIPLCMVENEKKDKNIPTKHEFFLSMLEDGGRYEPKYQVIAQTLRSDEIRNKMIDSLSQNKLKGTDPIGFVVDGVPAERSQACGIWWSEYRKKFSETPTDELPRCLITGELAPALVTVPKVSGLMSVGGHTSGDAFLCFDKDAFQSYGLKKSANAPVSEEGMTAVNAALNELIEKAPVFGGAKMVHWYAGEIPDEVDPFGDLMDGMWGEEEPEENEESEEADEASLQEQNAVEKEKSAHQNAKQFLKSVWTGERPAMLSARYYIMPLSGAGGRMMVRGWYEGSFEDLYKNIDQWFDDLQLVRANGRGMTKPPKLAALCYCLLRPGSDSKREMEEHFNKDLANLAGRIINAIISGNPLPDEVAARSLYRIRSANYSGSGEEKKNSYHLELRAFQLLKAWLVRRQRQRGDENIMGTDVETASCTIAYCCGQLMAVYAAIQEEATEVNVGVVEKYYAAASSSPALVIGKLAQLSQYYLSDLEKKHFIHYDRMLGEIYTRMGQARIPVTMNLEQQTEFALGYYQQRAAIYTPSRKK